MKLIEIINNAYLTQRKTNHKHKKIDTVYVLGANAGILCIVTGSFMFAFLSIIDASLYSLVGLLWIVVGLLCFILLSLYRNGKNSAAGHAMIFMGVVSTFLGVGFFLGGLLIAITGVFAVLYSKSKLK
ncbi:hypothetical protein GQ473_05185 [archaeon]|nr:hypothetical protein [archaeon]